MKVLAGIILFNPDKERLLENINAIYKQVDCLLLIENGSTNLDYIDSIKEYNNIIYINNHASKGIAYALNQICGYAYTHGYKWALTLDQDSVATPGMVDVYKGIANDEIGIIGCKIEDRNYVDPQMEGYEGTFEVPWVITSASFTNTEAWFKSGGFDNEMFIDFVDTDICYCMKKAGYKIMTTYNTKLIHEIGTGTTIKYHPIFKRLQIENHNPTRKYYRERNLIYIIKKYNNISKNKILKIIIKDIVAVISYERNKLPKLRAMLKGLIDSLSMKPKYQHINDEFLNIKAVECKCL